MVTVITRAGSTKGIMSVSGTNGKRISMHSTPPEFDFEHVPKFGSIDRDGKQEITRMVAPGIRELSFTHMIAHTDYRYSIEPTIIALQKLVRSGSKVRFSGGSPFFMGAVWFHVTGFKISAQQLSGSNRISRATVTWTIKQAVDTPALVSRKKTSKSGSKKSAKKTTKKSVARTHKIKSGDRLWNLAAKYLGNGARWPEIVKANKRTIPNPNRLKVGTTIKIPKK
ncbi:LysM peptidoglycan-binding domain-containing protein [Paeniglutamicibacter sp. R2-26]|uniref:LysM peptidoglycan-binding domain-containing protein n=1 Tax=Paeniglutamicibacter sp. R2-26 TaxID=3144417 RepID=UPI003EE5E614